MLSYLAQRFEVPYELSGKTVKLVVDPHGGRGIGVENDAGQSLGAATPLDVNANLNRVRRTPVQPGSDDGLGGSDDTPKGGLGGAPKGADLVDLAHQQYYAGARAPVTPMPTPTPTTHARGA